MKLDSKAEAERVLNAFPDEKLAELLQLAESAKSHPHLWNDFKNNEISLPDGWVYRIYTNSILVRYEDGEQERKTFWVPSIAIYFLNANGTGKIPVEVTRGVIQRFALGICSCGKPMRFVQMLLWTDDMIKQKGAWRLPLRILGYTSGGVLNIWILISPKWHYSLMFNRHPNCL